MDRERPSISDNSSDFMYLLAIKKSICVCISLYDSLYNASVFGPVFFMLLGLGTQNDLVQ